MLGTNAILSDWNGQITLLEQQDLQILCGGNDDGCKNINETEDRKEVSNCSKEITNIQSKCSTSRSSVNHSVDDEQTLYRMDCDSPADNNESQRETSRESSLRFGSRFPHIIRGSSQMVDSMVHIMIDEYQQDHEPTSAILDYCKRKVLRPYVVVLSIVGLNPISTDTTKCRTCLSYLQCFLLTNVLLFGYFLQYFTSYRTDRGFSTNYKKNESSNINSEELESECHNQSANTTGELLFGFIIPSLLHLTGYISAVILCKFIDHEQLQNLMERTFLMSIQPKKLFRDIWIYMVASFLLCGCIYACFVPIILAENPVIHNKWNRVLDENWQLTVKVFLITTLLIQNFIEIIILSRYCIECYLLKMYLLALSHKQLTHSIETIDWMKEILQFQKLLEHLNKHVSLPTSFFVVLNLTYAAAGSLYMFNNLDFRYISFTTFILNFTNVIIWLVLGLLPFFMAASLTQACNSIRNNGHQIRTRPLVYHNTSVEDLNSVLIFSSTMDMSAKLFQMPIQSNYIYFVLFIISVVTLTIGMYFNISILNI